MEYLSYFAERLKDLIIENGLTPKTLGEAVGIDRTTVTRYLKGVRIPSVDTFVSIADYFNCTADFLLGFEEISSKNKFITRPPFKEQLKIILDYAGISKYQLRKWTEIAESAIYDWQRGDNEPSLSNIVQMARKLNLSADFIIGRISLKK